jgi:glycosyltransferase involved in cell wall biosynthesis
MRRLLFDVSYTRMQRENVGITRTVRRLLQEFGQIGVPLQPVVFSAGAFRPAPQAESGAAAEAAPPGLAFRLATSRAGKQFISVVSRLPWPMLRPLWALGSGRAYACGSGPGAPASGDVVLLCDAAWNYASWRAARHARRHGAAVVTMVHDLMPLRHPEFVPPLVVRIYAGWLREMLACSDAMICNSAATEADLRAWAGEQGLDLPRTGHFRLGADPRPQASAEPARPALDAFLSDGAPCFAMVGSIEPKKNHAFLLDAFEALWAEGVDARLVVAGRATVECREFIERLQGHPLRGRRLLAIHDASDAEIVRIYERARALVFPSLMEGFGLPLVEARTAGCPVIASDLPVFVELADPGVFLFPRHSREALVERLREHVREDQRARVGRMQPFLWRDSAAQCLQVVEGLLASPGAGARPAPGAA